MIRDYAFLPSHFRNIKQKIESETFPWFYAASTAYTDQDAEYNSLYNGSFAHIAMDQGKKNSDISDALEYSFLAAADIIGFKVHRIHRIRIGLIPISPKPTINPPHIDMIGEHKVGLLYLNDSDGETYIYREKFDTSFKQFNDRRDSINYYENNLNRKVIIEQSITPRENRLVLFDGLNYHSSSTPVKTKRRIAVNYVFGGEI